MIRILLCLGLVTLAYSQSYQSFVDEQLLGAGLTKAAILNGLDGSVEAASPGFSVDGTALIALFKNPNDVFAKGITAGGVKYLGIKGDSQSLYGKKGFGGVAVVKTQEHIIVGVYNESLQPGQATLIVERLGDYFREIGE